MIAHLAWLALLIVGVPARESTHGGAAPGQPLPVTSPVTV